MNYTVYFGSKSRSVLLGMKNISDKSCRGSQSTHFVSDNIFFPSENRAFYEMWENTVEPDRPLLTI